MGLFVCNKCTLRVQRREISGNLPSSSGNLRKQTNLREFSGNFGYGRFKCCFWEMLHSFHMFCPQFPNHYYVWKHIFIFSIQKPLDLSFKMLLFKVTFLIFFSIAIFLLTYSGWFVSAVYGWYYRPRYWGDDVFTLYVCVCVSVTMFVRMIWLWGAGATQNILQ